MKNQNLISFSDSNATAQSLSTSPANSLYQIRQDIRHTVRERKQYLFLNWLSPKPEKGKQEGDDWELAPEALVYIP